MLRRAASKQIKRIEQTPIDRTAEGQLLGAVKDEVTTLHDDFRFTHQKQTLKWTSPSRLGAISENAQSKIDGQ
jgi:hypothetical protein